MIMMVIPIKDQ